MPSVTRSVVLPAAPERVWAEVASPERLSRWFGIDIELDVRPGGRGRARAADGALRRMVVEDVEPSRRLAFRWSDAADASTVEIDLEPTPDGTLLRITETALPDAWALAAPNMTAMAAT